jgi:hypothetical protein
MKRVVVLAALAIALFLPAAAYAHTGHVHKVMGTVSTVSPTQLEVKTTDGKVAVVLLNAKTVYEQEKIKTDLSALKVGDRVVVEGTQATGAKNVTAQKVRIGTAPAPAAAARK